MIAGITDVQMERDDNQDPFASVMTTDRLPVILAIYTP